MPYLGALGTTRANETTSFDYFGEEITANAVTDLDYGDLMEEIGQLDRNDPKAVHFIKHFARVCFTGEEFDRFWRLARENRQTLEDVFEVLMKIVEAATGRPTEQPSDSSDGLSRTEVKSPVGSSSLGKRLEGRPDLQVIVAQAQAS